MVPQGRPYSNQPAYEVALEGYSSFCDFRETEIDVKGEGLTVAYEVQLGAKPFAPKVPDWPALIDKFLKAAGA